MVKFFGAPKGSKNQPESHKIGARFSVDLRTLFFYRFSWIFERFGSQNEAKNEPFHWSAFKPDFFAMLLQVIKGP